MFAFLGGFRVQKKCNSRFHIFKRFDSDWSPHQWEFIFIKIQKEETGVRHLLPRVRSLEESIIFHTYNRFRINDSSKDFSESYRESAWFGKILDWFWKFESRVHQYDSEESPGIIQNLQESLGIATIPCTLERVSSS